MQTCVCPVGDKYFYSIIYENLWDSDMWSENSVKDAGKIKK